MADDKRIVEPINADFDDVANAMIKAESPRVLRHALMTGPLPIGNVDLHCAVLDDETRILSATSIFAAFKRPRKGMNSRLEVDGTKIPPFLAAKNLETYITREILARTKLIEYRDGSSIKTGYDSELLADMCDVYLTARRDGKLSESQVDLAAQAEILQSAFARVGIASVIDEATGYQKVRTNDALRVLLSRYIADGLRKWLHTFPDSFFAELDRLYGNEPTAGKRPQYYGHFINKYVYDPIENGYVKSRLNELNIKDDGTRRAHFHRWLTNEGRDVLTRQIGRVEGVMGMCTDSENFKRAAGKQKAITVAPYLFDDMNRIIE